VFSAVTVFRGSVRTIVHNDAHLPGRQASNITHELSHGLLGHEPTPALDNRGCRLWDQLIEEEANILAGVLLLPQDACVAMALKAASDAQVAEAYGTSKDMARWRMGVSGARKIASRSRTKQGTGDRVAT
jgi:Zn-dependent peptidase ImmA (M78 family)